MFIEPGNLWENGYVESFIGKFRDELLNREIFDTLLETRVVIENWRRNIISIGHIVLWDRDLRLQRLIIMKL